MSPLSIFTGAPRLCILTTSFSALAAQNSCKAVDLLNQALARDPSFFLAQCQLAYVHDQYLFSGTSIILRRGWRRAEAAVECCVSSFDPTLAKHILRGPNIFIAAISITMERLRNSRSRAKHCRMILVFSS